MRDKLNELGVLTIGNYDHVISYSHVNGYWRPLETAQPVHGTKHKINFGVECKMEFKCLYKYITKVNEIIKEYHPYEEPVIYIYPLLT
ncbi:cytochrome C biogenesis protein [Virgibacillus proomii]|jgi:hypothetical protein|uniref:cytochrome C biogenesis protein n=1 Tax=Virgibacillus proomii TaxID=84407 RepID=UPI000985B380|nr:cytochrome C biogenesis protein [Virgibacillus proomii]